MKKLALLLFFITSIQFNGFAQTENYNLASQNLHKNVRKTIEHQYSYDKNSGGFVKKSVNIKRYNDDGNLVETFYLYNSTYSESSPNKTLYNYTKEAIMTGTKDISDSRGKYSTELIFTYDKKGNLTKKESVYKDGSKYYSEYKNDKKGRVISQKDFSKEGNLSAEVIYKYKGSEKTEIRTSYNSKDGSINGTYTTVYEDGIKVSYHSESKYGTSHSTYEYDKQGNLFKSHYKGKTSSTITYDYVYDKKDNWIKKHYRSGKYQYFYFKEIYFDNGDITGSSEFDRTFINTHGNFENVAVVPLKKKEIKQNNTNTTIVSNNGMPTFNNKDWTYTFVNMKDKVSDVTGKINLNVTQGSDLSIGSTVKFKVEITGADTKFVTYKVDSYYFDKDKKRHFWGLNSTANESKGTLCVFKEAEKLRGVNVAGLLMIGKEDNKISFYLQ